MVDLFLQSGISNYFYINYDGGIWQIESPDKAPPCMVSDSLDPLNAIFQSGKIAHRDRDTYKLFLDKINKGVQDSIAEDRLALRFRLDSDGTGFNWHRLDIYFGKDESGRVYELAGGLYKLNDREIKELKIINSYIIDKDPPLFTEIISNRIHNDVDRNYAFIQFDIINFKLINERYSEEAGNDLLGHILGVLGVCCGDNQPFTRLSSDIFMIVTPYEDVQDIYDFIRGLEKNMLGYKGMTYSFAFGVYLVEDRNAPMRVMGDSAAMARKAVKGNIDNIGFYNQRQKTTLKNKKGIEDRMQTALDNGEFLMYLQPKYSISDKSVIGAEALVRWIHPEKGLIPPNDFIPIFEDNGFIVKVDEYIWECACKRIRKWLDEGKRAVPISVNVSRVHFDSMDFIYRLEGLLDKYCLPKNYLELEITETTDNINSNEMIRAAKDRGFRLLMDDFGSGYSSLNTLRSTPFDVLKIDRQFLSTSMESERGQKIISHTVAMSKDIGLELIAEGVETEEQAEFLSECGCSDAQGFLYSRPLPADEFDKLIE